MTECSDISLLLGPFEDGELEPHEMQDVAFHLARCESCSAALTEITTIGRSIRGAVEAPSLDGFAQAVLSRIEAMPRRKTAGRWRIAGFDRIGAMIGLTGAMAATAVITAVLLTPYARRFLSSPAAPVQTLAQSRTEAAPVTVASAEVADATPNDAHAEISRLESDISSVAVWSEPQSDATVIWLPENK